MNPAIEALEEAIRQEERNLDYWKERIKKAKVEFERATANYRQNVYESNKARDRIADLQKALEILSA